MAEITINEYELNFIDLFRLALSEEDHEKRECAIQTVRHEVIAARLERLSDEHGDDWYSDPSNAKFLEWVARSEAQRLLSWRR